LERVEVRAIADVWPSIGNRESTELAINNSLNNLVGYPHGCDGIWSQWIAAPPRELLRLLAKLRELRGAATKVDSSADLGGRGHW
jgi:hypothetical protein